MRGGKEVTLIGARAVFHWHGRQLQHSAVIDATRKTRAWREDSSVKGADC